MTLQYGNWSAGIGDPTIIGWVTVIAYLLCAALCFWAASRRMPIIYLREEVDTNPKKFWLSLGVFLVLLGINKQLDLQSLLTEVGRVMVAQQGWIQYKRKIQLAFIVGIAVLGLMASLLCMRWLRRTHFAVKFGLLGFILLLVFVLIRASSFHHMDSFLGVTFGGANMNWILELGSLGIIFIAALTSLLMPQKQI